MNGRWYIGQSCNVERRRESHLQALRANRHHNVFFQRDFKLHGELAFEFHILEATTEDMLDVREQSWIAYHNTFDSDFGYNMESGGHAGKRMSTEAKKKIGDANRLVYQDPEKKRQLSERAKVRTYSPETRAKMRAAKLGKKKSPEYCEGCRKRAQARWDSGQFRSRKKRQDNLFQPSSS